MQDSPSESSDQPTGSRMMVEKDSIHETDDGIYFDCPQCGSNVSVTQIVNQGRCSGKLDTDVTETTEDVQIENGCTAELSLELVWEA